MMPFALDPLPTAAAAVATAVAVVLLARWALRSGWVDGGNCARKRAVEPVPLVGGAALLMGLVVAWAWIECTGRERAAFVPGRALGQLVAAALGPESTLWPFGGLVTAFLVGTIDDVLEDGLRPGTKLVGQALAGFVLALPLVVAAPEDAQAWSVAAMLALGAIVAMNAVNTFDNADGAASGLGVAGFALTAPLFAAVLLAFLPANVARRGASRPRAFLGDAGSHVVGFLFLLVPAAWPALALPLLDLARLSLVRLRLGAAPWDADRRHLAHRLQALGLAPWRVGLVLAGVAAPAAWLGAQGAWWALLGIAITAALFVLVLRSTPAPSEPDVVVSALDLGS